MDLSIGIHRYFKSYDTLPPRCDIWRNNCIKNQHVFTFSICGTCVDEHWHHLGHPLQTLTSADVWFRNPSMQQYQNTTVKQKMTNSPQILSFRYIPLSLSCSKLFTTLNHSHASQIQGAAKVPDSTVDWRFGTNPTYRPNQKAKRLRSMPVRCLTVAVFCLFNNQVSLMEVGGPNRV